MSSRVYFVPVKDAESIVSVQRKLKRLLERSFELDAIGKQSFVGIKLHFGDEGNLGHVKPPFIKMIVDHVRAKTENVFLTDSNVLYKTSPRTNAVGHLKIASAHGFTLERTGAPALIADGLFGEDYRSVRIGKRHFSEVKIARVISECDYLICATHVTGHMQTSLAGALKNLGMGCASRQGKYEQHSHAVPEVRGELCVGCGLCRDACPALAISLDSGRVDVSVGKCIGCGRCVVVCRTKALNTEWCETLENLQEKMVEYAYGVHAILKGRLFYINAMLHVTKDCDCLAKDDPKITGDLGILASGDPVSIDKASADIMNSSCGRDLFREAYPEIDWTLQLRYAEEIGLGTTSYTLERV